MFLTVDIILPKHMVQVNHCAPPLTSLPTMKYKEKVLISYALRPKKEFRKGGKMK